MKGDAQTTQKISRQQLDEALKRTKSGTRRAVGSDPSLPEPEEVDFLGPRDDTAPLLGHIDPSSLSPLVVAPRAVEVAPEALATPASEDPVVTFALVEASDLYAPGADERERPAPDTMLRLRPRTAFVVGLAFAMLVMLAAVVGFFAGRSPRH